MSRYFNLGAQVVLDLFILSVAYWIAFFIRFEFNLTLQIYKILFFTWPYVIVLKYLCLLFFNVPKFAWRYIGLRESRKIFMALGLSTLVLVVFRLTLAPLGGHLMFLVIPFGALAIDFTLSFLGITGVRVLHRMQTEYQERQQRFPTSSVSKRTLLIGAGRAGVLVAKEVTQNPSLGIEVVGFIDDNPNKVGTVIQGVKVLGDTASLSRIASEYRVEECIITMASVPRSAIREIHERCDELRLPVKIIPGIFEILGGRVNLSRIREVTIEDLLGRDAIELDVEGIGAFLSNKRVLVTGAGGSIGSELCRQIGRFEPSQLLLVEQAENALFEIHSELLHHEPKGEIIPLIADICDKERIDQIFQHYRPEVVFHAAAHKHVPMMEWNPGEAIKNNVLGTKCVVDASDHYGIEAFVMISTDKAVNPTSIMGATKRIAERYIQGISSHSKTKFVAVRFGNVLGSAGSVIPIFKKQIAQGGPVTVTHPEMQRYFMTIPEACQLVMQAATMGQGGEIFVLDMGESIKIVDLARDMIRLSGFSTEEIEITFTGTRPGEKLYEEISLTGEHMTKTRHAKIYIGKLAPVSFDEIASSTQELLALSHTASNEIIRKALMALIPEMDKASATQFTPATAIPFPSTNMAIH